MLCHALSNDTHPLHPPWFISFKISIKVCKHVYENVSVILDDIYVTVY